MFVVMISLLIGRFIFIVVYLVKILLKFLVGMVNEILWCGVLRVVLVMK